MFEQTDFERLAALLSGIEGRFILSLNDRPEVWMVFRAFKIEAVQTSYSMGKTRRSRGRVGKVIISSGAERAAKLGLRLP